MVRKGEIKNYLKYFKKSRNGLSHEGAKLPSPEDATHPRKNIIIHLGRLFENSESETKNWKMTPKCIIIFFYVVFDYSIPLGFIVYLAAAARMEPRKAKAA